MCGAAWAQEVTGSISGTVTDSKVALAQRQGRHNQHGPAGVVRTLTTDETRQYAAPLLPVGRYFRYRGGCRNQEGYKSRARNVACGSKPCGQKAQGA